MDVLDRHDDVAAPGPPGRLLAGSALAVVVAIVAGFVAGVVVPFFLNGLHHLPLAEVRIGAYEPTDAWPADAGPLAVLLVVAGGLAAVLGPHALLALVVLLGAALAQHRQDMDAVARRMMATALVLACAAGLAWLSPYGQAMTAWFID